ncbi:uncharacterized protein SAMN05660860_02299 [Geoalkalibacter ferrihydriticus]|uniref:Potassium ABC transporter ATPase n=2 Tax=Geoalkalibacter ferrihydriticus TaxID=392333 RepID=A0A0C2EH80_9BACT|nr:ATP-dependent sacrificial sulfur transferase LarE [Geoalkalibacter ferrihydriticus]KIH78028.1 potassium ABC transporter ATPase [Geoalkalibacter ferrihydriticus DSM 17813]SDM32473.1 uncharacterized protein SAMN05660860_02299 [Geoalkalibacter ferrihydriticus]
MSLDKKYSRLKDILDRSGSALIAFSGGVDSTFLLRVARDVLGPDQVIALTATSPTYPRHEFELSSRLAKEFGVKQIVLESNELEIEGFSQNPPDRCYHCKRELFGLCRTKAQDLGYQAIFDGSNCDDLQDHRPGRRAGEELQVRSPLIEAGLDKNDIRALSRELGLETWDKQPFACLSSRFPYGVEITPERLARVDRCETFLRECGFRTYRVRFHDDMARIELAPQELSRLLEDKLRQAVVEEFKKAGFTYVALDLQGYRSGSMNEILT